VSRFVFAIDPYALSRETLDGIPGSLAPERSCCWAVDWSHDKVFRARHTGGIMSSGTQRPLTRPLPKPSLDDPTAANQTF
jgi:hypothetical protein